MCLKVILCLSYLGFTEILGSVNVFCQILEVFCHYFFKHLFCPSAFCNSNYPYVGLLHIFPQISRVLFTFLVCFTLCSLDRKIYIDLSSSSLIISSAFSNLFLSPSNEIFISVTLLFNSKISIKNFLVLN